jgi:hypothetical protein
VARLARHSRGDVVVDEIGHAITRHQAIAGGEIDPHLPFRLADALADRLYLDDGYSAHGHLLMRS